MKKTIAFGTDGIRGNADEYPFTNEALQRLGWAIGYWAVQKFSTKKPKILIGSDTRISCERIKRALVAGLEVFEVVLVDAGIVPTPAVFQIINYDTAYDAGIMISASHNPYRDNGVKLFDARTGKLSKEDEQVIVASFNDQHDPDIQEGNAKAETNVWPGSLTQYQQAIKTFFPENFLAGIKIVLDCAHGATYRVAPVLFESFGAQVITLGTQPTGMNINEGCGSLHPEKLQRLVAEHSADIGFAFDGDGDRVAVVSKHGELKDGDDILALLLALPQYEQLNQVVGTVMTNSGFERMLVKQGKQLIRTAVGDKYVAEAMEQHQVELGGEASGHLIMKDYLATGDGIFVALRVLQSLLATNNWDLKTVQKMPQILLNVPVAVKENLVNQPYAAIIAQHEQSLHEGRILVRYSGTENLLRVMTEAPSATLAQSIAQSLADQLQDALSSHKKYSGDCS